MYHVVVNRYICLHKRQQALEIFGAKTYSASGVMGKAGGRNMIEFMTTMFTMNWEILIRIKN